MNCLLIILETFVMFIDLWFVFSKSDFKIANGVSMQLPCWAKLVGLWMYTILAVYCCCICYISCQIYYSTWCSSLGKYSSLFTLIYLFLWLSWAIISVIRGLITSIFIGLIYSVIVLKLNLTTGLVPNLNVSVALLGFVFIKLWTKILEKANIVSKPFTRQENTIIQTCAVACYSASYGGHCYDFLPFQFNCYGLKFKVWLKVISAKLRTCLLTID